MNTIATPYGTIKIIGYERIERDGVIRRERWTGADGYEANDYSHASSMTDASGPPVSRDPIRCGWCYLGAPHTADAHAAKLRGSSA